MMVLIYITLLCVSVSNTVNPKMSPYTQRQAMDQGTEEAFFRAALSLIYRGVQAHTEGRRQTDSGL